MEPVRKKPAPKQHQPNKPRPKMWGEEKETRRKPLSQEQEQRLSSEVGFRQTPSSGNQPWVGSKGDGQTSRFVFELKRSKGDSIGIGFFDVAKVSREAYTLGKEPALVLTADGMPEPIPRDWVAVPAGVFRQMMEELGEQWAGKW